MAGCAANKPTLDVIPQGNIQASESLDLRSKTITTYILYYTAEKLQFLDPGDVLEVITDEYEAIENDVNAWCRMTGHELIEVDRGDNYIRFYVKRSEPVQHDKSFALSIAQPGLLDLLTPLGLSLGAALSGMEVHLIFQGPAVRVLKEGFKGKLTGFSKPFSKFARDGLNSVGHIPPQEKLRQLHTLGAKFYACGPSMDHFGVDKDELIFDDVIIGEYVTFIEVLTQADVKFYIQ